MLTSSQYYRLLVRRTLDRVIDALVTEPRRVFGLESVFFPDLYWNDRPERRDVLRNLVNRGQLVFSGCGVTTPDTLLPTDEMLLRDLLMGQEWIRSRGMTQEPRTLYLPDSFGHSPGLPSVLDAAGIHNVAFHRIDGMFFAGGDTDPAASFPRAGSSAELLRTRVGSDFIWVGPDGSEVLAHWLAHGYGHADMIASRGFTRTLQLPLSWPDARPGVVAQKIRDYADQLFPLARTPYLLLALGHDFVAPVADLIAVIDGWNDRHYDSTGLWLVNASLDDYFKLVSCHRDDLDAIEFDPNPCWMGFYASRPSLKAAARQLTGELIAEDHRHAVAFDGVERSVSERFASERSMLERSISSGGRIPPTDPGIGPPDRTAPEAWWAGVCSNHHDFITGTSTDRVVRDEQERSLDNAFELLGSAPPKRSLRSLHPTLHPTATTRALPDDDRTVTRWTRSGGLVTVDLEWATAVFDETRGGTITDLVDASGHRLIHGPALGLDSYHDSGGLWRMGNEFRGGTWRSAGTSTAAPGRVSVSGSSAPGVIVVSIDTMLERRPASIRVTSSTEEPILVVDTVVWARNRRTVTLTMPSSGEVDHLEMHQPGGMVARPLQRCYEPTYWPLHSFAHVIHVSNSADAGHQARSLNVATPFPTGIHVAPNGSVEVIIARSAVKELAYGVRPILAPVWGRRWSAQHSTVAFGWPVDVDGGPGAVDHSEPRAPGGLALYDAAMRHVGIPRPEWVVRSNDPMVETTTVKPADRGAGLIVRLRNWNPSRSARTVRLSMGYPLGDVITRAWLTDSRERDIHELPVQDATVDVEMARHLVTVRLQVAGAASPQATTTKDRSHTLSD